MVENVNVEPPFVVESIIDGLLEVDTEKSVAKPVVAPDISETLIVHRIGLPAL